MLSRRILCWALLALVLVVGGALGQANRVESGDTAASAVAAHTANTTHTAHLIDGNDHDTSPCVVRSDCAGAWSFGPVGLLLAVVLAVSVTGAVVMVSRLRSVPEVVRSALMAQRLFRPPQFS